MDRGRAVALAAGAQLTALTLAALALALVGAIDDIRGLGAALRLVLQALAVAAVLATLPSDISVMPQLPRTLEFAILLVGGVWFVNLVNFMDGIDWMTVAEVVPVTAAVALLGLIGAAPPQRDARRTALLGGMIGFAPFNRPVARLFLGDVGSLPIGLMLGWILLMLASRGHLAAALLLPLYYLADATITLGRRLIRGERVWQAHRTHFYQRAPTAASRSRRSSCASSCSTSGSRSSRWSARSNPICASISRRSRSAARSSHGCCHLRARQTMTQRAW